MKKIILLIFVPGIIATVVLSCDKAVSKEKELYEVLNLIYPFLTKEIPPPKELPVPPKGIDSIRRNLEISTDEDFSKKLNPDKQQIIAIKLSMKEPGLIKSLVGEPEMGFRFIIDEPIALNIDSLNIKKFNSVSNDSLIAFEQDLLEPEIMDYIKFDKLLSFSNVFFNKEFDRAVLIASVGTSDLAGSSHLIFLEKINGKWKLYQTKLLEIS